MVFTSSLYNMSLRAVKVLFTAVAVLETTLAEHWEDSFVVANDIDVDFEIESGANNGYAGAQVWKVSIENEGAHAVIAKMLQRKFISIWNENRMSIDILVKANAIQLLKHEFEKENLSYVIVIEDLQKRIDEVNTPFEENYVRHQENRAYRMSWTKYHRLNDIHDYLDYLAKTFPKHASVQSVGKSYEGNDLKLIKISNGQPKNKAVFVDGGIHAREWISPSTVTYLINRIAENFTNESEDFRNIDWYFLPVLNPDGYEFTHKGKKAKPRLWRKNRKPSSSSCIGTDLNRNFGYKWGGQGTSNNPCSDIYYGKSAFSEPESEALADFIKRSGIKFSGYLTYHSYAELILYPWGYDTVLTPDHKELHALGMKMSEAMPNSEYKVMPSHRLYPAAGASDDWAKSIGIKYSYTIELPGASFDPPPSLILPVAKESFDALRIFAAQICKE